MAHQVSSFCFGIPGKSRRVNGGFAPRIFVGRFLGSLVAMALFLMSSFSGRAQTASAYVPTVVITSSSPVAVPFLTKDQLTGSLTNVLNPVEVMLDACGNVYTADFGYIGGTGVTVDEIPANGGPATVVENVGQYWPGHLGQDPTRTSLIAGIAYGTGGNLIPLTNCVPQPSNIHKVGGGSGALFYYYNAGYFAGDFVGNTYISTQSTCCVTGQYYLVQEQGGNGNILLTNQPKEIQSLAVDKNENVYFITAGLVYELPFSGGAAGAFAPAPIPFGTAYTDPVGLSVDTSGNLYVADEGAATIYEIPYESTGTGTGALNLADQFIVATGVNPAVPVAINARGDVYYTEQPPNIYATPTTPVPVKKLSLGNADFGVVPIGQTATRTLNFQFTGSLTPASVILPSGVFGTKSGGNGSVPCTAGTAYSPTSNSFCTEVVTFTPTAAGKQSSAVVLADAAGNPLATAYIEGVGQGAVLTLDPGTVAPIGSGLKSPAGVAVDSLGNTFIADTTANAIIELPAGGGAPVTLNISVTNPGATAALPLAAPAAVTVDGVGNLFVADTGNNRVIEVPSVAGVPSTANAKYIAGGFNAPASVFVRPNGDLYITDTGNNSVYFYPSAGPGYGVPTTIATGLDAPLATTVDASGNVFIANSGAGTLLEIPIGGGLQTVDAGLLNPSGLATDSSGALFVVDQGNFRVLRIPSVNGVLVTNSPVETALGVANPYGVSLDSAANLYVTDSKDSAVYTVNRTQVSLAFGDLTVASTSDALPLTIENAGNASINLNTPFFTGTGSTGDFAMISPTGACIDGVELSTTSPLPPPVVPAPVPSCDLSATFTPTASGARSETITFSGTVATSATTTATVSATAVLSGSGVSLAASTTGLALTTPATGSPFYGEPLVFSATIGGTTPSGVVSFVVDGVQVALLPVTSGVATLPLNSGLTGGTHSIYAVYKGDSANDGSSSAPLTITIARAPTTSVIAVTKVAYNSPFSLKHSNAGSCSVAEVAATASHPGAFPAITSDGVAFNGTVSSPGVGIPSGTLSFYSDGVLINSTSKANPAAPSTVPLAPTSAGFAGSTTSDADTLGDGETLGENNVLVTPHQITVVYSGDQNYLPSTSLPVVVTVTDVSPTTPITLPQQPLGTAPYCVSNSPIPKSQPSDPATYQVHASSPTVTASSTIPGTVVLTINSLGGYNGFVDIACPNLPKYATCSANPGQGLVQPSTAGQNALPAAVTLTITTNVPPYVPTANQSRFLWLPALILGIATLSSRRRFKQIRTSLTVFGLALLLIGGLTGLSGCGAGTSGSSGVVTPAGSYPITIVMQGAQLDTNSYDGGNNLDFQPDLPYSVPLTLVVK